MRLKKNKLISAIVATALAASCVCQLPLTTASAATRYTRVMEYIDRGLVAIPKTYSDETTGMYLSWRLLGTESLASTTFDIYKNGSIIASNYNGTNYTDTSNSNGSDTSAVYHVVPSGSTLTSSDVPANTVIVNGNRVSLTMTAGNENSSYSESNCYGYFDIPLNIPADVSDSTVGSYSYTANDCSVGDVDGDGQYELIVKWDPSNSKDNATTGYTGNVLLSCYEFDGTELWSQPINLGKNIRAGAHYTQFMVYDFDGNGVAELIMKTAPGSTDGNGNYVSKAGNTSTITSADNSADYRTSGGYLVSGPEYLTVFDGATGAALQTIDYTPAYSVASWGDSYGNRGNRFLAGVGYFGNKDANGNLLPSVVMCRGYYTQAYVIAYDWDGSNLTQRFYHQGTSSGSSKLYGQGNHNLTVTDVDNDGYDEIVYGSAVLDHTGSVLSNTRLGHGDAMHVNDFNNDGTIEVFQVHEDETGYEDYGGDFWIPSTGNHIYGMPASGDTGRGVMDNIDDDYAKSNSNALALGWTSSHDEAYDIYGNAIAAKPTSSSRTMTNSLVYWDGDLGRELLDDAIIGKYDASSGSTSRFYFAKSGSMDIGTNNSSKYNANITADLFGDWREEIIGRYGDGLRVYISTLSTDYKLTTLMHDAQYRLSVATENVGYNQPPHTSYYIGSASLAYSGANYLAPAYEYTKMTTPSAAASGSEFHFDFGNGDVQSGYIGITDSNTFSAAKGYGFTSSSQSAMTRAPGSITSGYESLYNDQINGDGMDFAVNVPNGTYKLTFHYGSWNTGFGTKYTVEGTASDNLYSTVAATYTAYATVTDGQLNIDIDMGGKKYGGYINGLDIVPVKTTFHFDFGDGNVQDGYTAITGSNSYLASEGYGFTTSTHSSMTRAPGSIASGYENLYNDQIQGDGMNFAVDIPNGVYSVTIHYGSWNTGFGTNYTVEGTSSGNLASTEAATYKTYAVVTDGQLDVDINLGAKKYGGYINGLDITPAETTFKFDFGDGDVQSGYTAVTGTNSYSADNGYGFTTSTHSSMTRAPGSITSGYENLYNDQIQGDGMTFVVDVPNGTYNVTIHYGSWNSAFGTNYTVEGASSGNLASTVAATYTTQIAVSDGQFTLDIAKGAKTWGGYINGLELSYAY